ncbi:hypothetical protein Tco_0079061 [Tanacetum coccineum]
MLIARKRVRALPSGHLASRYPPDHSSSDHFSSDVSSSDFSSDYSLDSSSDHSLPDYPVDAPVTISVGPSRKRCRSPAILVPLATPIPGALSLVRADLLPPCKRIRGSISASDYDDSIEESYDAYTKPDINLDVQAGIDVDTTAAEAVATREAHDRVEVGMEIDREDKAEEEAESDDKGTREIGVDRVSDIESAHGEHGRRMFVASEQSTVMLDNIGFLERDNEELRQIHVSRYYDKADFRRLETFSMRRLGYCP